MVETGPLLRYKPEGVTDSVSVASVVLGPRRKAAGPRVTRVGPHRVLGPGKPSKTATTDRGHLWFGRMVLVSVFRLPSHRCVDLLVLTLEYYAFSDNALPVSVSL